MKKSYKNALNFSVSLALAVLLLYYAFRGVNFSELVLHFSEINYFWVAISLVICFIALCIRSIRWGILIEPIGKKPSFTNLLSAVMIGYLANLAFPRIGEVAKCGSITKSDGVRFDSLLGTVVVERAFDLIMTAVIVLVVIVIKIDFFGSFFFNTIITPLRDRILHISPLNVLIILVVLLALFGSLWFIIRKKLLGSKVSAKISSITKGIGDGLKSIIKTKKLPAFLITTVLMWVCYWLMTWLFFFSTPTTANLNIWDGLFIMIVGTLGMVVPVQGGFGAYHSIVVLALAVYGIQDGLVYAIIAHESQTLLLILGGFIALVYQYFKSRKSEVAATDVPQV